MIKAVLFDVAGVLTDSYTHLVVDSAVEIDADLEGLAEVLVPVFAGDGDTDSIGHQLERGQVTLEEFLGSLGPAEADARAILHPDSEHFFGHKMHPAPDMHDFVAELVSNDILTAVVSNNVHEWQATWDRNLPPRELFSAMVFSATEGVRKPNAAIYELALTRLGVAPNEALFLDDFVPMVEGAREAGLHAVQVDDHATAISAARRLLAQG